MLTARGAVRLAPGCEGDAAVNLTEGNGHADLIVSGDADLLALNPFREIPVVTPAAFVQAVAR
jgi:predicted nucleic acid-binding protein